MAIAVAQSFLSETEAVPGAIIKNIEREQMGGQERCRSIEGREKKQQT